MALLAALGLPPVFGGMAPLIVSRVKRLARAQVEIYARIIAHRLATVRAADQIA